MIKKSTFFCFLLFVFIGSNLYAEEKASTFKAKSLNSNNFLEIPDPNKKASYILRKN